MIQYNGITLLRDEDGTPMQVNIDLRVHVQNWMPSCVPTGLPRRNRARCSVQ